VETQVVQQLLAINRKFYSEFARPFSETRSSAQTRLDRIVAYIGDGVKLLDVGCGNGRLAERLEKQGKSADYYGVDASSELIAIAQARKTSLRRVAAEFSVADISSPNWTARLPADSFDIALALAVLHHVPSFELRCQLFCDIRALVKPGGTFVMTNWHFERNERLRKKIVPWRQIGLDESQLEPGDALMTWERGGVGYRYCHLLTIAEIVRLAEQSGFQVIKQFYADADLNLYSVLRRPE
jgi:tRNA (uracil-5-)-methyltransferase TRM9